MTNRDIQAAWNYHEGTKHSLLSLRSGGHYLDWSNHPLPFKIYSTLDPIPLPRDFDPLQMSALEAAASLEFPPSHQRVPDRKMLAQVLHFSAGITKRRTYPGGEIFFRAAACTGALYSVELYLVTGDLADLEAGVYHFGPGDFSLCKLRAGDFRRLVVRASGEEPSVAHAPVILVSTGTYWRNAWKYQARTYRHFGWDNGTILANMMATAAGLSLPTRVVNGFVDEEVNPLLSLDTDREVALSLVSLGYDSQSPREHTGEISSLELETVPLSRQEVDYPAMREMHAASCLRSAEEVIAWRGQTPKNEPPSRTGRIVPLEPLTAGDAPADPVDRVILRRGSARRFTQKSIHFAQLSTLLHRATQGVSSDFLDPAGTLLNELYLIVHSVEGLPAGAYVLHRNDCVLECLKEGDFRREAGHLGLDQELPANAAVTIFFLADLNPVLKRFGNRGYRAVQLEAGILGGKLYLASYAQGLGATGLTFYDDEVTEFFSPHARGKSAIFLVAVGKPPQQAFPQSP